MPRLQYTKRVRLARLHDELVAAGLPVITCEGTAKLVWVTVPDGTDPTAVAAVVQAHDPRVLSVAEAREQQWQAEVKATRAALQGALADWSGLPADAKDGLLQRLCRVVLAGLPPEPPPA